MILSRLQVYPAFVNILTSFGAEDGPYTDGRSGFHGDMVKDETGISTFETAYMLKYVECHGRPGTTNPWSVRQMAVYQNFNDSTKLSSCLLIQTSVRAQKGISEAVQDGDTARIFDHWSCLHELYLGTLSDNWAAYIKCLDVKIADINLSVRFTKLGADGLNRVTFKHLQQLSEYSDLLIRLLHALQLNLEVLELLSAETTRRQAGGKRDLAKQYQDFQAALKTCITEHTFLKHHASLVHDSAERLTVVTFLSMGFIRVKSSAGVLHLEATVDMWIYLAIAAPLTLVTLLGWLLWVRRRENLEAREQQHKQKFKDV
ncbi:MAG: hypothetical protein M1840_000177 [Geoglossum simile]|nr:MAG: hypothetical protein M1840_000177 [Geoglossum simile]